MVGAEEVGTCGEDCTAEAAAGAVDEDEAEVAADWGTGSVRNPGPGHRFVAAKAEERGPG